MPKQDQSVAERRHPEWRENQIRWRWLLDSLEGGDRYRQATYGTDTRGLPVRNLIRHKREYPDPQEQPQSSYSTSRITGFSHGTDPYAAATDDDYELRRARTPVPTFVSEAVVRDISKIFGRKPSRVIPETGYEPLIEWTENVDGQGTSLSDWIEQTAGPIFLTLGQLDVCFDHPEIPEGEEVRTQADVERLGIAGCVASYILPENVVDWCLEPNGRYEYVVIREFTDADDEDDSDGIRYRKWTKLDWQLFGGSGKPLGDPVPHSFGVVPIVRIFDRKKARCQHTGQSRYEATAERQREYYNRDSELILSDTTQAHPLLTGPEDYLAADGTVPIGPNWLLPKKKNNAGGSISYEGFEVIDFPKGGADSIRLNKAEIRDDVDRDCGILKPAGASGTGRSTVAQSGVSKVMDAADGNDRLGTIAGCLARFESTCLGFAGVILANDPTAEFRVRSECSVSYPSVFGLASASDLGDGLQQFQALVTDAGVCPEVETIALQEFIRAMLPGQPDTVLSVFDDEIRIAVESRSASRSQAGESLPIAVPTPGEPASMADGQSPDGPLDY